MERYSLVIVHVVSGEDGVGLHKRSAGIVDDHLLVLEGVASIAEALAVGRRPEDYS